MATSRILDQCSFGCGMALTSGWHSQVSWNNVVWGPAYAMNIDTHVGVFDNRSCVGPKVLEEPF